MSSSFLEPTYASGNWNGGESLELVVRFHLRSGCDYEKREKHLNKFDRRSGMKRRRKSIRKKGTGQLERKECHLSGRNGRLLSCLNCPRIFSIAVGDGNYDTVMSTLSRDRKDGKQLRGVGILYLSIAHTGMAR